VDADWLYGDNLYSCNITPGALDKALSCGEYFAVYITSPDYLGNMVHIKSLSDVCHKHGVPLLVDNAHGAYLKFTGHHPVDNGADMCCDSAHKTLSCLTGSAYLHVSNSALHPYEADAKRALSLFASTSPSYLILASMDKMNETMLCDYERRVRNASSYVAELRTNLSHMGFELSGREALKINIKSKSVGFLGTEIARLLEGQGIHPEFSDNDNLVLMFSTENDEDDFERVTRFFSGLEKRKALNGEPPQPPMLKRVMSPRQAFFAKQEQIPVNKAVGRILASPCVSCPPAIPVAVCGELLDDNAIECFRYYGIEYINVVI